MKHVTMAEKSLLVGDEAADTLVRYAAHLARISSGDDVQLRALNIDGGEVTATFLLNSGTSLMAESTESVLPEPDNGPATAYMRKQLEAFEIPDESFEQTA
jgi:hypothetical protein